MFVRLTVADKATPESTWNEDYDISAYNPPKGAAAILETVPKTLEEAKQWGEALIDNYNQGEDWQHQMRPAYKPRHRVCLDVKQLTQEEFENKK